MGRAKCFGKDELRLPHNPLRAPKSDCTVSLRFNFHFSKFATEIPAIVT